MDNFVVFNDSISQPIHAASSDSNLIKIVNEGFSKISPQEIKTIEDAWIKKYSPTIFKYYYDKIAKWTIEHPFGAFGVLTLIFLLLINCLLILLYLISPHKLFSIKSFTKSLPSIKIKYKEIEFSFESVLLTNFLICTDRAITGYYKINCDIFLQRNLLYFNTELDEIKNYLPFPIQINNKGTGN
ncbi:MAG TPA: hypothetical protein VK588_11955, partial [Chitinophagaceae bacterium]|nr:hypothetical protein [Chitinophagaceae bacterium]